MSKGQVVHLFDTIEEGPILLRDALIKGMSPSLADEFLEWVSKTQEHATKPRTCPFCGVPV